MDRAQLLVVALVSATLARQASGQAPEPPAAPHDVFAFVRADARSEGETVLITLPARSPAR